MLDKHHVGQTSRGTNIKWHKHQVGHTSSWTNNKWDKHRVVQISSGEKHQVGQTICQWMGLGQILSGTNIEWDKN